MKEGWEYSTIGKICKTYSGGTPLKNVKEYYQDGNIPWLRSGEVCKKCIYETELFITQKGLENSSAKYYPIDTVVVAMYGATAAQVGILKIEATSNQAVCGILPNSKFAPEFLYYFFCYRKEFLASQAQGGAQPNISQVKIKNLEIPVPPLSEQQSIVDYLDSAFAKIDAMKANAEKALNEAKALFQASLKEMLEPKEGWEEKTIEHFARIVHGKNQKEVLDSNGSYPIYGSGGNIMGYANAYLCEAGTTILGRKGTIDNPLFIDERFWNVDTAFGIIAKDNCNKKYLYYSIKKVDWAKLNTGTTLPSLTQNVVYNVAMCAPSLSEQQAIVATLDSLKSKVDRLQENYDKISQECDALKQAILRQVFE